MFNYELVERRTSNKRSQIQPVRSWEVRRMFYIEKDRNKDYIESESHLK